MPLPTNLTTVTVTGRFVDSQGAPIQGSITFSSTQILTDRGENVFVVPKSIKVTLDAAGAFSVVLPTTNDPDVEPVNWVWTASEGWAGGRTWTFLLPESLAPTVDLTDIAPVTEPAPVSDILTVSNLGVTVARQTDLVAAQADADTAQATAITAVANAAAAQATADEALADANGPHPDQGSVQFTADDTITPAVSARGVGGQTSPVLEAVDNTGAFRMFAAFFDRAEFNVPVNMPYATVSDGFNIDGAGRRLYWSDADPGAVPVGNVWADGDAGVLKQRTASGWAIPGQRAWDVSQYGATGDGSTNDAAAINAVITQAAAGDTIWFRGGKTYAVAAALAVSKKLTFTGGGTLKMTATNTPLFSLSPSASDSAFVDLRLEGPGAANNTSSRAVTALGTSTSNRVSGLHFERLRITGWNRGLDFKWAHRCRIVDCDIWQVYYAGVHVFSGSKIYIMRNDIREITGPTAPTYGITLSRAEVDSMAVSPWSTDCVVAGNTVDGPAVWEGIDTHAGIRILIQGNTVRNAMIPIAVVSGPADGSDVHAPLMCSVVGNIVECTGLANTRNGIQFIGDQINLAFRATGVIHGNTVVDVGSEFLTAGAQPGASGAGGIFVRSTQGLSITGNTIIRPVAYGINLFQLDPGTVIADNTVVDPYSDAAGHVYACHTAVRGTSDSSGTFTGNTLTTTGSVSALFVATRGFVVGSGAGSRFQVGANEMSVVAAAADRINDGLNTRAISVIEGKGVTVGQSAGLIGMYGTAPIAKQTVTGSRGGNAALASLLTAMAARGDITNNSTP